MSNYNSIAPYYDFLSFLIFGNTQRKAAAFFLKDIPENSRILIVGGGTGGILEDLAALSEKNYEVVFLEKSIRMLERAEQRKVSLGNIWFICQEAEVYKSDSKFDCIITPFLLDNFSDTGASNLITHLRGQLAVNGIWIDTDFREMKGIWQLVFGPLIRIMYWFFSWVGEVKVRVLPKTDILFEEAGFRAIKSDFFYKGLIRTVLYQRLLPNTN